MSTSSSSSEFVPQKRAREFKKKIETGYMKIIPFRCKKNIRSPEFYGDLDLNGTQYKITLWADIPYNTFSGNVRSYK